MRLWEILNAYHRFWRYRLRSERSELAYLFKQRLAGSTVIDIGANRGVYSYWMHRRVGRSGRVIAFEPQPELAESLGRLKQRLSLRQLTIEHAALSDSPGSMQLVRPRTHWGAASFHLDPKNADCDVLTVPVTTLDAFAAENDLSDVRFLKCDVQDHEVQVLRGGAKLLATWKPTVLVEQVDECFRTGELSGFLQNLGYRGYFFYKRQLVHIERWAELRSKISAPFLNYIYEYPNREVQSPGSAANDRVARRQAG